LGMRFGALLAEKYCNEHSENIEKLVFWQPIINGAVMLNQLFRLRLAADMIGANEKKETAQDLKNLLNSGVSVEIAGYSLNPDLYNAIQQEKITEENACRKAHHWIELVADDSRPVPAATKKLVEVLQKNNVPVHLSKVQGEPFWSLQEITIVPALIEKTVQIYSN